VKVAEKVAHFAMKNASYRHMTTAVADKNNSSAALDLFLRLFIYTGWDISALSSFIGTVATKPSPFHVNSTAN
jgi:hypothetical protein